MRLKSKCAIVTGSSRGIGLAVAERLAAEGAHVIITARSKKDIERVVSELSSRSPGIVAGKTCDLRDPEDVAELVHFAVSRLGSLEILINNAGVGIFKSVEEMAPEEWQKVLRTNLDGVFYCCHYAIPEMKKSGGGFIINISSLAGKNPFPNGSAYNASKFGLTGFSEALMEEVRHDDIRVAYIMPGSVDTWFRGRPSGSAPWKLTAADVADVTLETLTRDPRCLTSRIEMRPSKPPRK